MFYRKLAGLAFVLALLILGGCSVIETHVVNMSELSDLSRAGVVYIPEGRNSLGRISHVDGRHIDLGSGVGAPMISDPVRTVYVSPGQREIEVHVYWNRTDHYTALRINVQRGHSYRIVFDKPTVSFRYEDLGRNMSPSDMRTK